MKSGPVPSAFDSSRVAALVAIIGILVAILAPSARATVRPELPSVVGRVPITQANPIWMASQVPLYHWGYIEEEYFVEGMANVYVALEAPLEITQTIPYRTRILVRRPSDVSQYSGNVVLEPIHPGRSTPALATTFRWIYGSGDVWVGVEPPGNISFLQQFNAARYESLTSNPELTVHDLLSQASALIQSPSNPIPDLDVRDVFMQGVSATCRIVSEYINLFHRDTTLSDGGPIISGYMPSECTVPLVDINVPIVRVVTQADFNAANRKQDSDDPNGRHRLYELAGAAHFSTNNPMFGEAPAILNGMSIGDGSTANTVTCKEFGPPVYGALNDFPVWVIFDGAMRNLQEWVQTGEAPPRADRFVTDSNGNAVLDAMGNFQGGVRTPLVDSPTATWYERGTDCRLWGYKVPFEQDVLESMYPTHYAYVRQVKKQAQELLRDGWVTIEDAEYLILHAERSAVPERRDSSLVPMQPFYPFGTP